MSDDSSSVFDELLSEAVHEPRMLVPGAELADGRFVVRTLLGAGGMGAVYRATDTRRGLDIAVKVLSRVEAAGIYRLKQEFRSLSNVVHPNLVARHELHSDGGTWFFTMDLVDGRPLSQVRCAPSMVRRVFAQIAEAIHAIHRQGKLHRDLKPSNVMVTPPGQVVVLDFGLVSDQQPARAAGTSGDDVLAGTPAYMAPEQAAGHVTPQSDWYAFGTMLYESLFGRLPFSETGVAVLARKCEGPAPRPPTDGGEVPGDLEEICLRLLERDPARRPGFPEIIAVMGAANAAVAPADDPMQDPFVGREEELRALEQALLATDRGHSAVVAVSGSAGIGKTRLVRQFLEGVRMDPGSVVLSGRCPRWEHIPFPACDSVIDDLSRHLGTLPSEGVAPLLPRATQALTRIFPVLEGLAAVRMMDRQPALPREPLEVRRLGLTALRELLGNIAARQRLVIFVDDMHWSDLDGGRLLGSLVSSAARPNAPTMLLVIAHRPHDAGEAPGLEAFLDRVASNPDLHARKLRLQELGEADSRRLVALFLKRTRDSVEHRVAREAGGNPLFIRQLVHHVQESGSDAGPLDLDGVVTRRIARHTPLERATLAAICLTPRPQSLDLLSRITDQADPEPSVRTLESARLVCFTAGSNDAVTVFHERIREVVVSGMDAGERRSLHARSAEVLEQTTAPDPVALTLHYLGCGRDRDAAASAVRAAGSAESALAFEQAAAMYRLALDLGPGEGPERIELLVRLAEVLELDRRSGEAGADFLRAASLEADGTRRRALRLRAADQYLAGGWLREGLFLLREILSDLGLDYDAICVADLLQLRRQIAERGLDFAPRLEGEIAPQTRARLDAVDVAGRGLAWLKPESTQFRFVLALEALAAGDPMRLATGLRTVARFDAQLDPDDDRIFRVVRQICEDHPGPQADLVRIGLDAGMALVRGRPWETVEAARRNEELLLQRPTLGARVLADARFLQAQGLCLLEEVHELHRCWGWLEDAEDKRDLYLGTWLNAFLASEQIARGRTGTAREMCHRARRIRADVDDTQDPLLGLCRSGVLGACDAYDGDDAAWDRLRTATRWFDGSPVGRMPFLVGYRHWMLARAALACAKQARPGPARDRLLHEVEADISLIAQPRGPDGRGFVLPHYRNMATLLGAGLAALRGDPGSALCHLDRALDQLRAAGSYTLLSAHARRARGILLGGTEGEALVRRAEADLRGLGVEDPALHARTVLPGFPA